MIRELRKFIVKAEGGVRYTVVERAEFVTVKGEEVKCGESSFMTSTGWTVTPTNARGGYFIERLRLSVQAP